MTGAALVLSVVDTQTGMQHLVAIETAALHRRSGRYPALCGTDVITASLTTTPAGNCRDCDTRAQPRQREQLRPRRSGLSWRRRGR
jgi:hypothetical protein